MSQSTAFVLSLCRSARSFVDSLARIYSTAFFIPFIFDLYLSLSALRFIYRHNPAIRVNFSPTELWWLDPRFVFLVLHLAAVAEKRMMPAGKENEFANGYVETREIPLPADVQVAFFVGAVFNEFTLCFVR